MTKIIKNTLLYVLAFFILEAWPPAYVFPQDVKKLDNGLTVIVKEDHRSPIVAVSAFMDVGSAREGAYLGSGMSHLVEHMLFKGTKKYPEGAITSTLHKFGGKISAFTTFDYTGFNVTILKEHAGVALDVLDQMLNHPLFNAEAMEKEKKVIEREMDMIKDDPGRYISRLTFSRAFTTHTYGIPIIGYKDNFGRIKKEDVERFFRLNYAPEKTVIAVVGDISKEEIFREISDRFGKSERGDNHVPFVPKEPEQFGARHYEEKMPIEGVYMNVAFPSSSLLDKDLYTMDLLSFILGHGEGSVLNEKLRLDEKIALSVSSYNYTPRDPGLFIVSAVTKKENTEKTYRGIWRELEKIKERGVSEKESQRAKNNLLAQYVYQKQTIESIARDYAVGTILTGDHTFFESYIDRIKSVTPKDIKRVAGEYLLKSKMTVTLLSDSGDTLTISPPDEISGERLEAEKITLRNNLPVLIVKDSSLPMVSIALLFNGGVLYEEEENNGISGLLANMLRNGTKSMSKAEVIEFYESRGMTLGTYSGNNSMGITVNCLQKDIRDAMKLLSLLCLEPSFPEDELAREKEEALAAIEMQDNSVINHGHRLLKRMLFERHPYRFQSIGTEQSVKKIKKKGIVSFYEKILSPDNMVLGIAGDIDADEVKRLAERFFSGFRVSAKKGLHLPGKPMPLGETTDKTVKTDKKQSLVLVGFRGASIFSEDRYAVDIMVDALASSSGILFESLREKGAYSYAQGAFHAGGPNTGYIAAYVLTSGENISPTKDTIFNEIAAFREAGISDDQLLKTKNHIKGMREMGTQSNSSFVFDITLDELYGLGYDNHTKYNAAIDAVTSDDVKKAARKYLTPDSCVILLMEGI